MHSGDQAFDSPFLGEKISVTTHSSSQTVTDDERKRRKAAVDYARVSVGLEGFKLSSDDEKHAERFVSGEIELSEFLKVCRDVV
jgi:hypothetical protein